MDDLVTWLRAQLDEDERVAHAAIDPKHRGDWAWRKDSRSTVRERDGVPIGPEARGVEIGPHIARWNPARVLREVESKRRILDGLDGVVGEIRHLENKIFGEWNDSPNIAEDLLLRLMATVYDDRPGYQESWRP